jgi:hypothetical protein
MCTCALFQSWAVATAGIGAGVALLGGSATLVFEAGRVHKTVTELEPKVQELQTTVSALRTELRHDMRDLNGKLDKLLLSFLPKPPQ